MGVAVMIEDLPEGLRHLSPKRKDKLKDLCIKERKDAALNVCVIGIKGLNHVHKMGLNKLARIAEAWGGAITEHYKGREQVLLMHCKEYGDLVTDPLEDFSDLSDSRKREITKWLTENRKDAADTAYTIGLFSIKQECGFGQERIMRLNLQWQKDIGDFYEDREVNEPRLQKWVEEIGFIYKNGRLLVYNNQDKKLVRKKTAEQRMEKEEKRLEREKKRQEKLEKREDADD